MTDNPASFTPEKLAAITGKMTPAFVPVIAGLSSLLGAKDDATAVASKLNVILDLLSQTVVSTANIVEVHQLGFGDVFSSISQQLSYVPSHSRFPLASADLIGLGARLLPPRVLCRAPLPGCKD